MKNKFFGMLALAFALVLAGCATNGANTTNTTTADNAKGAAGGPVDIAKAGGGPNTKLTALLRTVPSYTETWDREVTLYYFNPEFKDELIQAIQDSGFIEAESGEYTRDWGLQQGVLRWCVSPDIEKWDSELQFSAQGETTVHTIGFKPGNPVVSGGEPNTNRDLPTLLRIVPSQIQIWNEGRENEHDVTVYDFNPDNPALKDELLQALQNSGFIKIWDTGKYTRDWELERGVLRWCVSPDTEKWRNELQFSAQGETTVYTNGFMTIPNSDGVPKTITITGLQGGDILAGLNIFAKLDQARNTAWAEEIDGQTITYALIVGHDGIHHPWTGTGEFFIVIGCSPPRDPSYDGSKYVYSEDGVNPAPVDIKDAVTTLEWSKFIWLEDYNWG
ncbi:MAG: hypothetical protein LBP20_10045 [Treponema sp.]|nr:hypothetical protein [Treponema sp.]